MVDYPLFWLFGRSKARYFLMEFLNHKAILCDHGEMQKWGINYWETYAPVVNWVSVRTLHAITKIHNLRYRSFSFGITTG